jgi:Tol biopolymer transport system component
MFFPHSLRSLRHFFLFALLFLLFGAFALPQSTSASKFFFGGTTTRVSVASDGLEGNGNSGINSISWDGRYIAFESTASNLVISDTNNSMDIFVYDYQTGQIDLVSISSDAIYGNNASRYPSISGNGRYVAFQSLATNLVANDTNVVQDIFVHDRQTGQTTRVSILSNGTQPNSASSNPSISGDGLSVAFVSAATNLVDNDTNGVPDVFAHNRLTSDTTRVSIASDSTQGNLNSGNPSISGDGRYVTFSSSATNLVKTDFNDAVDVFVHDRLIGQTIRIPDASYYTERNVSSGNPSISADGRYVAFQSDLNNLVDNDSNDILDIFVHDRETGQIERVSVRSNGTEITDASTFPDISADGRYVTFMTQSASLVGNDTNGAIDIFLHDRQTRETSRVSLASDDTEGNDSSFSPGVSANGRYVAFISRADNLVDNDMNGMEDVFVRYRESSLQYSVFVPVILK